MVGKEQQLAVRPTVNHAPSGMVTLIARAALSPSGSIT
jgi:hypothetical protein